MCFVGLEIREGLGSTAGRKNLSWDMDLVGLDLRDCFGSAIGRRTGSWDMGFDGLGLRGSFRGVCENSEFGPSLPTQGCLHCLLCPPFVVCG